MHTTEKLALQLDKAKLPEMAQRARKGDYHDFLSAHPFPCLMLADALLKVGTPEAMAIRSRHINGEFDATVEESAAWAESPEGKAAYAELTKQGN